MLKVLCLLSCVFVRIVKFLLKVYSDNGTNFVGGISDLRSRWDKFDKQFAVVSARRVNVEWTFTTLYASHHNGAW